MTDVSSYSTGTVAIATNATSVVGTGSNWTGQNAMSGDLFVCAGQTVIISSVTDALHLAIDAWPFAAVTAGTAYKIYKVSPLRFVGGIATVAVDKMVTALDTNGFYVFVPPDATEPDPSLGQDEQYALQATTGKLWQKTGGTWNFIGIQKGFSLPVAWDSATAFNAFDVATINGTSYVCILANTNQTPPNATYWTVLASKGDAGSVPLKPIAAWVTATAYVTGPPASYVSNAGSSYECLIAHASGAFATDLTAGKWGLVAQAGTNGTNGTPGAGYGGTSATSFAIGTGSKAFTTQAGLAYQVGNYIRASSAASGVNFMEGNVTAYSGGTLTINITKIGGTGTHTDWNFQAAGVPGTGDMLSTNNLADVASAATARANLGLGTAAVRADADFPRTDVAQSLTATQKAQGRANLSVGDLGFTNRVINPSGQINTSGAGTAADGTYWFDQWLNLNEANPVTPSRLTNAENGTPFMMRTTQSNATAQRFGISQPLESANVIDLRGQSVTLSARVRCSAATTLRFAIVEWTGTADTVTKDIVNNWSNGTFTPGNFFITTTTTVVAAGSLALSAATFADISLTGVVSGSMNNLHVFFWTDSQQAQNVTLDVGKVQLEEGTAATRLALRSIGDERRLCNRYFQVKRFVCTNVATNTSSGGYSQRGDFDEMRVIPTVNQVLVSGGFAIANLTSLTTNSGELQWAFSALNTLTSGDTTYTLSARL